MEYAGNTVKRAEVALSAWEENSRLILPAWFDLVLCIVTERSHFSPSTGLCAFALSIANVRCAE